MFSPVSYHSTIIIFIFTLMGQWYVVRKEG